MKLEENTSTQSVETQTGSSIGGFGLAFWFVLQEL